MAKNPPGSQDPQSTARRAPGKRPEPMRKRVNIPVADAPTLQWWELQDDPHASVRLLIHDEIERNGYSDRVNRVQPRPCMGHPPLTAEVVMQLMNIQELLQLGKMQQPATSKRTGSDGDSAGIVVDTDVSNESSGLVGIGRPFTEQPQQTRVANHAPARVSQEAHVPVEPVSTDKGTEDKFYNLDEL